jgi:predicted nucleic acid-binding protein
MTTVFHLDACWLIALGDTQHEDHAVAYSRIHRWISEGGIFGTSAIAWSEFLRGKKEYQSIPNIRRVEAMLHLGVIGFVEKYAEKDAEIFNRTGRLRSLKGGNDRAIAATAIVENAELATFNIGHFRIFVPFGLRLAGIIQIDTEHASSGESPQTVATDAPLIKRA